MSASDARATRAKSLHGDRKRTASAPRIAARSSGEGGGVVGILGGARILRRRRRSVTAFAWQRASLRSGHVDAVPGPLRRARAQIVASREEDAARAVVAL